MTSVLHLERLSSCITAVEADFSVLEQHLYQSELDILLKADEGNRKRLFSLFAARFGSSSDTDCIGG